MDYYKYKENTINTDKIKYREKLFDINFNVINNLFELSTCKDFIVNIFREINLQLYKDQVEYDIVIIILYDIYNFIVNNKYLLVDEFKQKCMSHYQYDDFISTGYYITNLMINDMNIKNYINHIYNINIEIIINKYNYRFENNLYNIFRTVFPKMTFLSDAEPNTSEERVMFLWIFYIIHNSMYNKIIKAFSFDVNIYENEETWIKIFIVLINLCTKMIYDDDLKLDEFIKDLKIRGIMDNLTKKEYTEYEVRILHIINYKFPYIETTDFLLEKFKDTNIEMYLNLK